MSEKWNIECPELGSDEREMYSIHDEEGRRVAVLPNTGNRERDFGNAALVAAAPELYDALVEAVVEMCHNISVDTGYCRHFDRKALLCRQLDGECFVQKWLKILAKARGEVRE